jgi:ribosome-associated translation inhibitor RaiA
MSDNLPVPVQTPGTSNIDPHARWRFLRDVGVFQFKLFLNNMHNFFQVPLVLVVALIDVIFKTDPEGARFYKLLEYGRTIDDSIDIYSVIAHREKAMNTTFTVDNVLSTVEGAIVREYQKGGSAASMKAAVDKVIDEMQAKTDAGKDKVTEAMKQAADKVKEKMGGGS